MTTRAPALALTLSLAALGCGGTDKQPASPAPSAVAEQPAPKAEPPPPPPDTGGYRLVEPAGLAWKPASPGGPEIAIVTGTLDQGGGYFMRLAPGHKPGLHTHTSDYHAIVISGAPKHWLPGEEKKAQALGPGSYWFQPGGQPHGDECTGTEPCVLYLVVTSAFDYAPAPNAKPGKPGKYFLAARKGFKFNVIDPKQPDGVKIAMVSGDPKTGPIAFVMEQPAGANINVHSHTSDYHALVVGGAPAHWLPHDKTQGEPLAVGTYWFQPGGYDHGDRCTGSTPCHIFVMMPKPLDMKPAKE